MKDRQINMKETCHRQIQIQGSLSRASPRYSTPEDQGRQCSVVAGRRRISSRGTPAARPSLPCRGAESRSSQGLICGRNLGIKREI